MAKYAAIMRVGRRTEVAAEAVERIRETSKAVDAVLERVESSDDSTAEALRETGAALKDTLATVLEAFVNPPGRQGIFASGHTVSAQLRRVYSSLQSSSDAPTEAQRLLLERAEAALEESLATVNGVYAEHVAAFRRQVRAANLELLPQEEPLTIDWKRKQTEQPRGGR